MKFSPLLLATSALICAACASNQTLKLDVAQHSPTKICIQENWGALTAKVPSALASVIQQKGMAALIYQDKAPSECIYILTYAAADGLDIVPYVRQLTIVIQKNGSVVATGTYHEGHPLSLGKFGSAESKATSVLQDILVDFKKTGAR